jgi:predicted nuclease with RNAse H fold
MVTLGIDLASKAKNTFACEIEWQGNGAAFVSEPETACGDAKLHDLIAKVITKAGFIGIDAPFGWPEPFAQAVTNWSGLSWVEDLDFQKRVRYRTTDDAVKGVVEFWPLSVSTDRIALPAMRAMALLLKSSIKDKSGKTGRFFEVYPAATLKRWSLPHRGYKSNRKADEEKALEQRKKILSGLRNALPDVAIPNAYQESDHALDALVASLTARTAALGRTLEPSSDQQALASKEGWIHVPKFLDIANSVRQVVTVG